MKNRKNAMWAMGPTNIYILVLRVILRLFLFLLLLVERLVFEDCLPVFLRLVVCFLGRFVFRYLRRLVERLEPPSPCISLDSLSDSFVSSRFA